MPKPDHTSDDSVSFYGLTPAYHCLSRCKTHSFCRFGMLDPWDILGIFASPVPSPQGYHREVGWLQLCHCQQVGPPLIHREFHGILPCDKNCIHWSINIRTHPLGQILSHNYIYIYIYIYIHIVIHYLQHS